jgi:flavorubredoxin
MAKALVVYSTRSGESKVIGEFIAEGIRMMGVEAVMIETKKVGKVNELDGYDAYIFGSATYHGDLMNCMKTFLFLAEKADLEGKVGGSFGSFGWSGEAPERIYDTMKNIFKMDMVSGPLMLKSGHLGGGIGMSHDYGKEIAKKIKP